MVYAEINEDGKCFAISDFGGAEALKDTLIPLDSYNIDVLGKIWDGSEWTEDETLEPEPIIISTETPKSALEEKLDALLEKISQLESRLGESEV